MKNREALPIYMQIAEGLQREIETGELQDGARLPPERVLATQLSVSIGTLRKALNLLSQKGVLQCRQGSGNYVSLRADPGKRYNLFRIERLEGGGIPSARMLDVALFTDPVKMPRAIALSRAHRLRRLRYLDDTPSVVEEIWIDANLAPHLDADACEGALYHYYKSVHNFWITRVEDRVSIDLVPSWAPQEFLLSSAKNCGYVERHAWAQTNLAVEFSRSWFNPDVARYVMRQQ